jgi:hypothetical protein
VAEQQLDRAQVGPAFEEMRRVTVTQRVCRHAFLNSRLSLLNIRYVLWPLRLRARD